MDKLAKFFKKLDLKERGHLQKTLAALFAGNIDELDIKKLKGHDDIYRLRISSIRVIFHRKDEQIRILDVGRRDDTTYRNF